MMLKRTLSLTFILIIMLVFSTNGYAKELKGAIVVMDLTTNAFQIEMADQAIAYGKEVGVKMNRYAPAGSFGD